MELNKQIKVLIVEDETIVALDIKSAISKLGYIVTATVTSHNEALKSILDNTPDIIMMDINLEGSKDGIQTAIDIKKIKDIPIIYLTAFSDDETIHRAIQTNPVGYLLKPFKINELKSTILLALFKSQQLNYIQKDKTYIPIGYEYYFDKKNQELYYKDKQIKLTQKEKQFLSLLVDAKGEIVAFETMEYELWDCMDISSSTLRTFLYRLRAKLDYQLIETVSMSGCRLN